MHSSYSASDSSSFDPRAFALKGGLFPLTLLEILQYDLEVLRRELEQKAKQAPDFFRQAPVILSVDGIEDQSQLDLLALKQLCQDAGLIIVALREAGSPLNAKARELGLAVLPRSRARTVGHQPSDIELGGAPAKAEGGGAAAEGSSARSSGRGGAKSRSVPARAKVAAAPAAPAAPAAREALPPAYAADIPVLTEQLAEQPNKLITTPIRSGQQVYAPGGDLIVAAPVSAGAELLADGNIHVYGALRGRALAGVKGNEQARIFCQSMEAELVSISGNFKLEETLSSEYRGKPVMIYLEDKVLKVKPLTFRDR